MDHFDSINSHQFLFLTSISELATNVLSLEITGAVAGTPSVDLEAVLSVENIRDIATNLQPIEPVEGCSVYSIIFKNYIAYAVRSESYAQDAAEDLYQGTRACIYTKSAFLTFLEKSTFASSDYPGPFTHYGFSCLNHVVDVVSCHPPKVTVNIVGAG